MKACLKSNNSQICTTSFSLSQNLITFALQIEKSMDFKMFLKSRYKGSDIWICWGACYTFEQEAPLSDGTSALIAPNDSNQKFWNTHWTSIFNFLPIFVKFHLLFWINKNEHLKPEKQLDLSFYTTLIIVFK